MQLDVREAVRDGQLMGPAQDDQGLPGTIAAIQRAAQSRQAGRGLGQEVEALGDGQQTLQPDEHRRIVVFPVQVAGRELQHQGDTGPSRLQVRELLPGG